MSTSKRVVLVGVGGPTCSGKTTLSKWLRQIIPNSVILHQDDFAPPVEKVPIHPIHNVQDWDSKDGAVIWERQRATLHHIRQTGEIPDGHASHDHLNEQTTVAVKQELVDKWTNDFRQLVQESTEELVFVIFDGFLAFVDPESVSELDVKLFVRESYDQLKKRREERSGYHTAVDSDPEGSLWTDPPGYWDNIVWPAYLDAHAPLFLSGDVVGGAFDPTVISGAIILEASQLSMEQMVNKACKEVFEHAKSGKEAK